MANFRRPQSWDSCYSQRRPRHHSAEAFRLEYDDGDTQGLIKTFLRKYGRLDPPSSLTYLALDDYLRQARLDSLPCHAPGENTEDVVLLDDRRHWSERAASLRLGEDEDHQGKVGFSNALSVQDFFDRARSVKVCHSTLRHQMNTAN